MTPVPVAGGHGGDGARVAAALGIEVLDLSASLNPVAPDPLPVVARHMNAVGRYPDCEAATAALAGALGVDRSGVLLTNGGAEAIALVAGHLGPGRVDDPDFALYGRHLGPSQPGAPRWRSDPHNPSGRLAPPSEAAAVWDEAFYPLATGRWTSGRAASGAIVLGSLTKVFACPGLRAGYVIADPVTIRALAARQPQWSVNGLVCAALPDLLASADLPRWRDAIASLRAELIGVLEGSGFAPLRSDANYVLVGGAAGLRESLAPHGVLVRDCGSFGLPGHARVAVPDEAGLERLAAALKALR